MIEENGLSVVTVKKEELLKELKKNLEGHRKMFLEAQAGFRTAFIKELDSMLEDARAGRSYRKMVMLEEPQDQSAAYARVIRMLEMCIKDTISITEQEFAQYVLDDWSWKKQFLATSNRYMNG